MYSQQVATIFGFLAMSFVVISYFLKSKSGYLLFQLLNMFCLALSYLFFENFFAMIGLTMSALRTFVFFVYEKREKTAPLVLSYLFATLAIGAWLIVNVGILKTAQWVDGIFIVSLISYAFIFRIRNFKIVRYTMLFPLTLSIIYNLLSWTTVFAVCSYAFELVADIVALIKDSLWTGHKEKENNKHKE